LLVQLWFLEEMMRSVSVMLVLFATTLFAAPKLPFSWDYLPIHTNLANRQSGFTDSQLTYLAGHFNFISIEKGHGKDLYGSTEEGFKADAAKLHKLNPKMKIFFYWNSYIAYESYAAFPTFDSHPAWALHDLDGDLHAKISDGNDTLKTYDQSNLNCRKWWTDVAVKAINELGADGINIDAWPQVKDLGNKTDLGTAKYDTLVKSIPSAIHEIYSQVPDSAILLYNGLREGQNTELMPYCDGSKIEHFGYFGSTTREDMAADMKSVVDYGKAGKVIVFKAWPDFAWSDDSAGALTYAQKEQYARERITFPLACFLVSAQKFSYFFYTWGYDDQGGTFVDYPEYRRPLGKPVADAAITGWVYTRKFENADVTVDLDKKSASITWAKPPVGIAPHAAAADLSIRATLSGNGLHIRNSGLLALPGLALWDGRGRRVRYLGPQKGSDAYLSLAGLSKGPYLLSCRSESSSFSQTIVIP
jgi:hypothetical protein